MTKRECELAVIDCAYQLDMIRMLNVLCGPAERTESMRMTFERLSELLGELSGFPEEEEQKR